MSSLFEEKKKQLSKIHRIIHIINLKIF